MADDQVEQKLVDYIEDNHAMERNVKRMLESMISTQKDERILADLTRYHEETDRHIQLLEERLAAHGKGASTRKDLQALGGAFGKGLIDMFRGDKEGKNMRDAYVTEHLEIAAYQLLERLADRAGDGETAAVARTIRADEEAMARKIDGTWDIVVDQTLKDEGVPVAGGARQG